MQFTLDKKDKYTKARTGEFSTDHGNFRTPVFMPVGTAGTVKGLHQRELSGDVKAEIILGNTYHFTLRPGVEMFRDAGGIHEFINWHHPVLTDSGGYQVFSLASQRHLSDEGVTFRSHIDGSKYVFTPESVVDIERTIGADIIMPLDECTPYPADYEYAKNSVELTHAWLKRGYEHFRNTHPLYGYKQAYFPILQGSVYKDLRIRSAKYVSQFAEEGVAIGGLSVGEPPEKMYEIVDYITPYLPENIPRYLMGVGTPANILEAIAMGVDMFDCVMPTRNGRNGMLFTKDGIINIKNHKWKTDFSPIDPHGSTFVDNQYSKAYLRHLVISKEILGAQIASIHNLGFYLWLVKEARNKIYEGNFYEWKNKLVKTVSERL